MDERITLEQEYAQCNLQLKMIEEEYAEIDAAIKKIESEEEEYEFIYSRTSGILNELSRYWDDPDFGREIDRYEEELFTRKREIQDELEDKKDELFEQRKKASCREDEYAEKMAGLRVQMEEG